MHPLLLILFTSLFAVHPPANDDRLLNTTWKVAEIKQWESMEKMYTGMTFRFDASGKVQASNGKEHTVGTYALHPTPPDLEIIFSRTLYNKEYEAKDEFKVEYPSDTEIILRPFYKGSSGSIRLVKVSSGN